MNDNQPRYTIILFIKYIKFEITDNTTLILIFKLIIKVLGDYFAYLDIKYKMY
jgi:hypothetical protein